MKNLVNSLAKYTGLTVDELTIAFKSVHDEVKEDVQELLDKHIGLDTQYDDPSDWAIDYGNFLDALFENYTVEAR